MTNFRLCPWMSLVTAAFALGCGNEQSLPVAQTEPAQVAIPPAEVAPISPKDKSLTPEEYVALGMPSHDKVWHSRDMEKAVGVLQKLETEEPAKLPRLRSLKSDAIFSRLISTEHYRHYQDPAFPIDARFGSALHHWIALHAAFRVYSSAFNKRVAVRNEQFEIFGAAHHLMVVLIGLADEFRSTLRPVDPQYKMAIATLEKVSVDAKEMVTIGLDSLVEMILPKSMLDRLLAQMEATYPLIVPRLSSEYQAKVLVRLRELESAPQLAFAKDRLRVLREKLVAK